MSGVSCPFCPPAQRIYLASPSWFVVRHLDPVPLAGWMLLVSRAHHGGLEDLADAERAEVGSVLSELAAAVRAETGCDRVYSLSFNEAVRHLHLHLIPRHAEDDSTKSWALADRYRATTRGEVEPANADLAEQTAGRIAMRALPRLAKFGFASPR